MSNVDLSIKSRESNITNSPTIYFDYLESPDNGLDNGIVFNRFDDTISTNDDFTVCCWIYRSNSTGEFFGLNNTFNLSWTNENLTWGIIDSFTTPNVIPLNEWKRVVIKED